MPIEIEGTERLSHGGGILGDEVVFANNEVIPEGLWQVSDDMVGPFLLIPDGETTPVEIAVGDRFVSRGAALSGADDQSANPVTFDWHRHHLRPIWGPFTWNMSPNQPPMPVLASRHFPPPVWPLRRRRDWEILPPPGIFMALRPYQVNFRSRRYSTFDVQFGPANPHLHEVAEQVREEERDGRRRGRRRRIERDIARADRAEEGWPEGSIE